MGWCKVKKRIKGHLYLYEQRRWREGGKVRTESRYIGPVSGDGAGGSASSSSAKSAEPKPVNPTLEARPVVNPTWERPHSGSKLERLGLWFKIRLEAGSWSVGRKCVRMYAKIGARETLEHAELYRAHYSKCVDRLASAKTKRKKQYWERERKATLHQIIMADY